MSFLDWVYDRKPADSEASGSTDGVSPATDQTAVDTDSAVTDVDSTGTSAGAAQALVGDGERLTDDGDDLPEPERASGEAGAEDTYDDAVDDEIETDDETADDEDGAEAGQSDAESEGVTDRATGGWFLTTALVVAVVAALALGVANLVLHLSKPSGDGLDAARSAAVQSANKRVPRMLSYSYNTIDADIAAAGTNVTGDFKTEYTALLTQQVKPSAIQGKISTVAKPAGTAVVSAHADSVLVLMFLDLATTSGAKSTPQVDGSRVEVTMKKVGKLWLVSALTPI